MDAKDATVVIFADTFSNNFEPEILHAARRVLEAAGHRVAPGADVLRLGRHGELDFVRGQFADHTSLLLTVVVLAGPVQAP